MQFQEFSMIIHNLWQIGTFKGDAIKLLAGSVLILNHPLVPRIGLYSS